MKSSQLNTSNLSPITPHGLGDDVYAVLLGMLTSGDLEPESPLSIDRLARSLSVSPTPVREALARLEHTGLVTRTAHRGYRVSPPMPPEEMRELIDARIVLELSAVERAMQNPYPLIDDLETALREHQRAATILGQATTPNDHAAIHRYYRADWQFHQAFLDHCHNRFINRAANELSFSNHRMRQTSKSGPTDVSVAISEHQAILDAARTADINLTRLRMLEHLENVKIRATALGGE